MDLHALLGDDADGLLNHTSKGIAKEDLHLPGPDFLDRCLVPTDRSPTVLRSISTLYDHGRLAGTGYVSILPVDQGIEHSAAASFAPNPAYFDPANIVELAIEGGCNAVASTFGVLGASVPPVRPQDPVHRQAQPQRAAHVPQPVRPDHVRLGAGGLRHGRGRGRRHHLLRLRRVDPPDPGGLARPSRRPTSSGMFTVLWCYLRNNAFKTDGADYHASARPHRPGQPPGRHDRGRHHQAEAAREQRGLQRHLRLRQDHKLVYDELTTDHPIDLCPLAGRQLLHGPHRAHQLRAASPRAPATWPTRCGPR